MTDKWGEDSKAKDSHGNLLRLFHGTSQQFDDFGTNRDGGHYFTPCRDTAAFFAENPIGPSGSCPRVIEAVLRITNPYVLDYKGLHNAIGMVGNPDDTDASTIDWTSMSSIIEEAKEDGHDGLWLTDIPEYNGKVADQWVVFEKHQIKLLSSTLLQTEQTKQHENNPS